MADFPASGNLRPPATPQLGNTASPVKQSSRHASVPFSANTEPPAEERQKGYRLSMDGKIVMISYEKMMDDYVPRPVPKDDEDDDGSDDVHEPTDRQLASMFKFRGVFKPEVKMYGPFTKAINNGWLKDSSYRVVTTASVVDPTDKSKQRVDCAMYHDDEAPGKGEQANWSAVELSIECKVEPVSDDPFDDDEEKYQPKSLERRKNLGQIMSYAALIFAKQHRTHHFTLVVLGNMARIVRWDRAGTIVTEKFDYMAEPEKLGRFLWRFARMTNVQRGHDPTATRLLTNSEEYKHMKRRAIVATRTTKLGKEMGKDVRLMFKESLEKARSWWKLSVPDGDETREFLVGAPHFVATGLAGRGTRGYIAIDWKDKDGPFVFLKDCWRVAHDRIEQEGSILDYLKNSEGPSEGIPTMVCHGDINNQTTESQSAWRRFHPDSQEKCPLKTHRHYRLVVREVGLPMSEFENAEELVYLIARCIQAHLNAYNKGVIHRDISAGNVLIYVTESEQPDGSVEVTRDGLLTDWELSKRIDDEDGPRQHDRTGTWQFMPVQVLENPDKTIDIFDEIESFFHLLLWFAIRYLLHNCKDVGLFISRYFDDYEKEGGQYYCGPAKKSAMHAGSIALTKAEELTFYLLRSPTVAAEDVDAGIKHTGRDVEDGVYDEVGDNPFTDVRSPTPVSLVDDPASLQHLYKHPIDTLIKKILRLLHSRYALLKADKEAALATAKVSSATNPKRSLFKAKSTAWYISMGLDPKAGETEEEAMSPAVRQKLEENVAKVTSQAAILKVIGEFSMSAAWPQELERLEDQLPKNYRIDRECLPVTGSKRISLHDEEDREYSNAKRQSLR